MGKDDASVDFRAFAHRFVTAYWQDVIDHPALEPVEETLDELLATVSWELREACNEHAIIMRNEAGDAWNFSFGRGQNTWTILKFNDTRQDLLSPPYDSYFRPMLERVMRSALGKRSVSHKRKSDLTRRST